MSALHLEKEHLSPRYQAFQHTHQQYYGQVMRFWLSKGPGGGAEEYRIYLLEVLPCSLIAIWSHLLYASSGYLVVGLRHRRNDDQ